MLTVGVHPAVAKSAQLADVCCYGLAMANELGVDLSSAIESKMIRNEQKYPAEQFRGVFGADDPNRGENASGLKPDA